MCRLVFLGPSLDLETARGLLSDAIYLPPLRQADLLSAVRRYQPHVIGIVDGYFLQDLSVWHKEILYALQRGIAVYGSSSMGALRAAEMAPYGMRGIGTVYQAFADGTLVDDDEVALAHAPEELNYEKHSEPMVNIRATLEAALARKVISSSVHDRATEAAKATYFPERNLQRLSRVWRETGLPDEVVKTLNDLFRLHYVDVKRQDAITLLKIMAALKFEAPSPRADLQPPRTISFDTLEHRDRRSETGIALSKIFRFAAIHSPEFESLQFQAMNRTLTAMFAANLGLVPQPDQIGEETRRFRAAQGLSGDEAFLKWLRENDLTEDEFSTLMGERAACRLVQQWWLSVCGQPGLRAKITLDELRLSGDYRAIATEAAHLADLTSEELVPDVDSWTPNETRRLLREHAARTGFRLDIPVQRWARETGYFSYSDMLADIYLAKAGNDLMETAEAV
ncbi:MAG TPA: TfuA-like protein [Bryobacteraceae bacterium]|jgi:hypothetical protein|nr:TfuA-like protein [Bryobacteraceae bacterium]